MLWLTAMALQGLVMPTGIGRKRCWLPTFICGGSSAIRGGYTTPARMCFIAVNERAMCIARAVFWWCSNFSGLVAITRAAVGQRRPCKRLGLPLTGVSGDRGFQHVASRLPAAGRLAANRRNNGPALFPLVDRSLAWAPN